MIRVTCEPRRVVLEGHAGYAPKGSDIVCAAVSMLVYVQFHLLEEQGLLERSVMRPGYVELSAREGGEVKVLALGMRMLAQEYPRCVRIEEKN